MVNQDPVLVKRTKTRRMKNRLYQSLFFAATCVGVVVLVVLIVDILRKGIGVLNWDFLTSFNSYRPENAGLRGAIVGSIWIIAMTAPLTFVVGVCSAIYLEEYAKKNRWTRLIQLNISNLAGVPSIVYGLLGLALFARGFGLGRSILSAALTLTLLVLPIIIVASREALASVPDSLRHASYALGATRWQTIYRVVLPRAFPGIMTGTILALSRAIGETAPLLVVGAMAYVAFSPRDVFDIFTTIPIQIYNWTSLPQEEFQYLASAGIIVLLVLLLTLNAFAILMRNKYQKRS